MKITLFRSIYDTFGEIKDLSWQDFISQGHEIRTNKDGLCFLPGISSDNSHKIQKIRTLFFLIFDVDSGSMDQNLALLQKYDRYEYFLYTTFSHSEQQCKYRIVFPLKKPVEANDYERIHNSFDLHIDKSSNQPNRLHYLPSAPPNSCPETIHNKGAFFDPSSVQIGDPTPSPARISYPNISLPVLRNVVKKLAKNPSDPVRSAQWSAILKGEAFSLNGNRHDTLIELCFQLVNRIQGTPESLAAIFDQSIEKMDYDQKDVLKSLSTGLKKVLLEHQHLESLKIQDIVFARPDNKPHPYTETEISEMKALHNLPNVDRYIILYKGRATYYLSNGGYLGPYEKENIQPISAKFLAPFGRTPLRKGELLGGPTILWKYGTPIRRIYADLTIQESYYDPADESMHEATAKSYRKLTAREHSDIHEWLDDMGGARLLDWVAATPLTDQPICGLYLYGDTGTGKSLLAIGLARLWSGGIPTDMAEVFGNFDERIAINPLIFADEEIPPTKSGQTPTALIRQLIGTQSRTIRRKHFPSMDLLGSPRCIFATNESTMFQFSDTIGKAGQEALAKRILYIKTKRTLERSPRVLEWLSYAIAEHALWLSETRTVESGKRLFVEGDATQMLVKLNIANDNISAICKWIVKYLIKPMNNQAIKNNYINIEDGVLYINNQAIDEYWTNYLRDVKKLSTRKISAALAAISKGQKIRKAGKRRLRFWEIDIENIIAWAEEHGYSTEEDIRKALEKV